MLTCAKWVKIQNFFIKKITQGSYEKLEPDTPEKFLEFWNVLLRTFLEKDLFKKNTIKKPLQFSSNIYKTSLGRKFYYDYDYITDKNPHSCKGLCGNLSQEKKTCVKNTVIGYFIFRHGNLIEFDEIRNKFSLHLEKSI